MQINLFFPCREDGNRDLLRRMLAESYPYTSSIRQSPVSIEDPSEEMEKLLVAFLVED